MNPEIKERIGQIENGIIPKGYKTYGKYIMPIDWDESAIGKSMEIRNNLRFPISKEQRKLIQGIFPYYGPTRIQDYIDRYTVEGQHVLIGEDGDHFLKYKELNMTLLVDGKFNVNNHAHILRGTKNCATKWFYYYYQHKNIYNYITRQGAGRYKLTKVALYNMKLVLPRMTEQNKIISILSTWDKNIDLQKKLIEQKQEQKKGLMQRLLTGAVRLSGFSDEWEEVKLGKILSERKDTGFINHELLAITSKNGVVKRTEINIKDNSNSDKSKYKRICKLDIGYNTMRMWQGVSGVSEYEGIVSPAYTILTPSEEINSYFIGYLFKLRKVINVFWRYSQGMVSDTLNLKYENLKEIKMKIPINKFEQDRIASILKDIDNEIELLEIKLNGLEEQKKGLMQLLLTGIVRVNV